MVKSLTCVSVISHANAVVENRTGSNQSREQGKDGSHDQRVKRKRRSIQVGLIHDGPGQDVRSQDEVNNLR